jgi:hypothetical protein
MKREDRTAIYAKIKSQGWLVLLAFVIYFFSLSPNAESSVFSEHCSYEKFRYEQKEVYSFKSIGLKMSLPESWEVSDVSRGDAVEVTVQSGSPCKIFCLVTSRILSDEEKNKGARLLDDMLNGSINHLKSVGHEIIDVGKTDAFGPETAGFVIVSAKRQDKFATLSFGGLKASRNVGVTIRSESNDNRHAISKIVRDVVKAVDIR